MPAISIFELPDWKLGYSGQCLLPSYWKAFSLKLHTSMYVVLTSRGVVQLCKVQVFWEIHLNLTKIPNFISKHLEILSCFWGLLRIWMYTTYLVTLYTRIDMYTANIFKVIFTFFNCVRLSTVVSLYGLHLIAAPSTIK